MIGRTVLNVIGGVLLVFLAGLPQRGSGAEAMFRGNPARTGVLETAAPKGIDHVRWSYQTGGRVLSSPVVADGVLYAGSNDHFLHALDVETGAERWKFATGGRVTGSPAVDGATVYFLSVDGNAYAVAARDGALRWKFATEGESRLNVAGLYGVVPARERVPDPWDFFLSSPVVSDGTVFFGSGDHHIYALDARSGRLRWKYLAGDVVHSSPALADGRLYVGCWDGVLYALDARSGSLLWKFATGSDTAHFMQGLPASPAVADGVVVIGSRDNRIYGLDARTGRRLWDQSNGGSWVIASAAVDKGIAYVTTSDSLRFRALDLRTGALRFELAFDAFSFSSPVIAGTHAYFGTAGGWVYDVDLDARRYASRFQVPAGRAHKELLDAEGHLDMAAAFGPNGPDGNPDNTIESSIIGVDRVLQLGSVLSSPTVAGGAVYVGSADGKVYALD